MALDFEDIKKAIKMMDRNGQLDLARWIINQDRIKRFSETDEDILSIRRGLDNYNEGIIFTSGEVKRKLLGRNKNEDYIQPTSMFWCVMDFQPFCQATGYFW